MSNHPRGSALILTTDLAVVNLGPFLCTLITSKKFVACAQNETPYYSVKNVRIM